MQQPAPVPVVDRTTPEPPRPEVHVVRPGDTLYSIAWRHGLDYQYVARINGIGPPYTIYVDQRIQLRGDVGPEAPAAVASVPPGTAEQLPGSMAPASSAPQEGPEDLGSDLPPLPSSWPYVPPPSAPVPAPTVSQPAASQPVPPAPPPEPQAPPAPPASAGPAISAPGPIVSTPPPTVEPPPPARSAAPALPGVVGAWRRPTDAAVQRGYGDGNKGVDYRLEPNDTVRAAAAGEVVYAGSGIGGFRHLVIVKHDAVHLSAYSFDRPLAVREGQTVTLGEPLIEPPASGGRGGVLHFEIRKNGAPVDPRPLVGGN